MKRFLVAAVGLVLVVPWAAFADDPGRGHAHPGQAQQHRRGHPSEAQGHGRGHPALIRVAENEDRRERERREREQRERREREREREREAKKAPAPHFVFRGQEYAAVRGPTYRYPRGWNYRAWRPGEVLPRLFIAQPYFLDYGYLGLPPPPPGTQWVRFGPDALLVDVYDGHILDVINGAFY